MRSGQLHTLRDILFQCSRVFSMKRTTITRGGQISLPAAVRNRWGTRRVALDDRGDSVVVRPVPDDPVAATRGVLQGRVGKTDALRRRAREDEKTAAHRR
jgi:AbrB family looped-hinge helix DNA binding protein